MYNLRYHIASLVAVFLALALGLVLGGLVVRQGGFDKQQSAIVSGLQKDFDRIKKQNASLKSDLTFERGYSGQMTDAWVAGRLKGRTVIILTSGAKAEGSEAAVSAVKAAGGSVAVVTISESGFGLKKAAVADAARSVVGTSTDLKTAVASTLASEWSQPSGTRPLTEALSNAGAIKVTGLSSGVAATQTVDLAAFDHRPDELALDIAQAYASAGLFALGAQTPSNDSGVAAAAAARKLSAFETLGTNPGKFTLVALFTGAEQGFYSDAPNATAGYPPVPQP